jgi:hypothetical protein
LTCFNCNNEGHWKKDYLDLKTKHQINSICSKNKAQKKDEVSLLLTQVIVKDRKPFVNEPLVIDLPAEIQVDVFELFFVNY